MAEGKEIVIGQGVASWGKEYEVEGYSMLPPTEKIAVLTRIEKQAIEDQSRKTAESLAARGTLFFNNPLKQSH